MIILVFAVVALFGPPGAQVPCAVVCVVVPIVAWVLWMFEEPTPSPEAPPPMPKQIYYY